MNAPLRHLLRVDCTAGLLVGLVVLSLSAPLAELYAMPRALVVGMGVANVCYGTFSLSLAVRSHPPPSLVVVLVAANAAWAVLCAVSACLLWGTASYFGLAQLVGEGLFVGGLARLEWTRAGGIGRAPDARCAYRCEDGSVVQGDIHELGCAASRRGDGPTETAG